MMEKKVKFGLVGIGNIGRTHMANLKAMPAAEVVGVCDVIPSRAEEAAAYLGTKAYTDHRSLLAESGLEAIIIAVPHYDHPGIAEDAFRQGVHVLCEKPLAVHINDGLRATRAYELARAQNPDIVFGIMFQERTLPHYLKIKDILDSGALGRLVRATWINTEMFRPQAYYDSGGWRATWAGEGGGILSNQCPHTLDMYQWLFGMPARITGHAGIGKYHDIEVEDEVTAYFEHEGGMIGHFIVSTIESPGTNRMEIVGERGTLVYERGRLVLYQNRGSMLDMSRQTKESFPVMESWYTEIPIDTQRPWGHLVVTEAFVDAILRPGARLIAHGTEGMASLALANGIMLSAFTGRTVALPVDADAYEAILRDLIAKSTYVKTVNEDVRVDMGQSFSSAKGQ